MGGLISKTARQVVPREPEVVVEAKQALLKVVAKHGHVTIYDYMGAPMIDPYVPPSKPPVWPDDKTSLRREVMAHGEENVHDYLGGAFEDGSGKKLLDFYAENHDAIVASYRYQKRCCEYHHPSNIAYMAFWDVARRNGTLSANFQPNPRHRLK